MSPPDAALPPLRGREQACAELAAVVAGAASPTVALIHGEPGIGKTALVRWTMAVARDRATPVLSATGVPTQQHLPFAGLRRLLGAGAGAGDRDPGSDVGPAPGVDLRVVEEVLAAPGSAGSGLTSTSLAVLDHLAEIADRRGLLVAVDDLQWFDRPSRDVVTFIGRRLGAEPISAALAARDEVPPDVAQAALAGRWRTLPLERLDDRAAAAILDESFPALRSGERRRVLDEAAGLPLALKQLPGAAVDHRPVGGEPVTEAATHSRRLEGVFASRLAGLDPTSRLLVLLAVVHDGDEVAELLLASRQLLDRPVSVEDLAPAVRAGLVELSGGRIAFTHPLARSATFREAEPAHVREAHRAFASTPLAVDRRVWHAAAAAESPDEEVAQQLQHTADRAVAAGAVEIGARAYEEAVRLSEDPERRARRQLFALELLADLGRTDRAVELLGSLEIARLDRAERVRADWVREALTDSTWTGGERVRTFVDIAQRLNAEGDASRAADLLVSISLRCWWSDLDLDTGASVARVADDLAATIGIPTHVVITALADPTERGIESLAALDRITLADLYPDSGLLLMLALAATGVGAHPRAVEIFAAAIAESRRQSRSSVLAQALTGLAWSEVHLGRLLRAEAAADEGVQLCRAMNQPLWEATGELALAAARGMRGDVGAAQALADRAERAFLGVGANPMLAQVRAARGFTALAARDPKEAFGQLSRVFTEDDASYHRNMRTFLVAELAEAAAYCGRREAVRSVTEPMEELVARSGSPILQAGLLVARPLLAEDEAAEENFRVALEDGLASWPLQRARVLLEYGAWLRRHRRISEARDRLRTAHETFAGLAATPWAERAARELRAAGDAPAERRAAAWEHLTSQELQIATMAAEGLTNREIGNRLLLSHRTVSTHLYHTFPKLGIASRAQLPAALADVVDGPDPYPFPRRDGAG